MIKKNQKGFNHFFKTMIISFALCFAGIGASDTKAKETDGYQSVPGEYVLDEVAPDEEQIPMATEATYTVSSTVTATLDSDGVLTVKGTGAVYCEDEYPWYDDRYSIKSVVIGSGITELGEACFYGCTALKSANIPSSVTTIGVAAFANTGLTSVTGMSGVKTVGDYAFQGTNFTSFSFPAGVTTIGNYVFVNNYNITQIDIPASVTSMGVVGYRCDSIQNINVNSSNANYASVSGVVFNKNKTTLIEMPKGKNITSYTIPSTVKTIGDYAFYGQAYLKSITIPSSVTAIGQYAFSATSALTSLTIPSSVTSIEYGLCSSSSALKTLNIKANVDTLPYMTCRSCSSLTTVNITGKVKTLDSYSISDCPKLTTVTLPSTLTDILLGAFANDTSLADITFPTSVMNIEREAFYNTKVTKFPGWLDKLDDGSYMAVATTKVSGTYDYTAAYQVLDIVNQERAAQGLSALTMDKDLLDAAMLRAAETTILFDHTRPNGTSCFTACDKMYAENIAMGYGTPESVMNGWMNSAGHKGNILGSRYVSIGIGCFVKNGTRYWVQCFGTGDIATVTKPGNKTVTVSVQTEITESNYGWQQKNNAWYYFYADGSLKTGWQRIGGVWYYMDADAKMTTGWQKVGSKWYYLGTNGAMKTGWQKVGSKWYYLGTDGVMRTGWQVVSGKWYYFNSGGIMLTGWQKIGGDWYYLNTDGSMATGWKKSGSQQFYLDKNGVMVTGWQVINGKWYYFYYNGVMAVSTYVGSYYVNSNGVWVQ